MSRTSQTTSAPSRVLSALAAALTLAACSGSGEDVRVTLCKDLVTVQLGDSPARNWTQTATETRGYEEAAVKLRWSEPDGDGSATCYYDYNAVEDTAMALSDPLSSYAASPSKMVLNANTLSEPALAEAVKQAMLKQGRSLVDGIKKSVN